MSKQNYYTTNQAYVPMVVGEVVDDPTLPPAAEAQLMAGGQHLASTALAGRQPHSHAEQHDSAVSHAQAHLMVSAPIIGGLVITSTGLVLLGWLIAGGPILIWIGVELLIAGAGAVVALSRSRRAGLEHTPAGVERHEIDARRQVAMYAINRHCEMVERIKGVRE